MMMEHRRRAQPKIHPDRSALRRSIGRGAKLLLILAAAVVMTTAASVSVLSADARSLNPERARGAQQVRSRKPPLVWIEGVLSQDRVGAWMLSDGPRLQTGHGVRWRDSETGREVSPTPGRHVRLMGQWRGNAFRVRQATVISTQRLFERQQTPAARDAGPEPVDEPS